MMKLKFIFLSIILLLFSGCQAEYSLIINDDGTIYEEFTVLEDNFSLDNSINDINDQLDWAIIMNSDEVQSAYFYNKDKVVGSDKSGLKYNYNFKSDSFISESDVLRNCFEEYEFRFNDRELYISGKKFLCGSNLGDNAKITVNIVANGEVIDGNFDLSDGNKYLWNFTSDENKDIELRINRVEEDNSGISNMMGLMLILLPAILIFGTILLIGYLKNKRNNM